MAPQIATTAYLNAQNTNLQTQRVEITRGHEHSPHLSLLNMKNYMLVLKTTEENNWMVSKRTHKKEEDNTQGLHPTPCIFH